MIRMDHNGQLHDDDKTNFRGARAWFTANLSEQQRREAVLRLIDAMEKKYAHTLSTNNRKARMILTGIEQFHKNDNPAYLMSFRQMKHVPVTIQEFLDSEEFLGRVVNIWPALREDLIKMNPDIVTGHKAINEVVLGGATSTGKTFLSHVCNLYDIYFLSCFRQPQALFPSLSPITPIVFMFQSVSQSVTERVIYKPFRQMFLEMPYTQRHITYDKLRESSIRISNGIEVVQGLATEQAQVGQAIVGGILDEVNFMSVVKQSSKVAGARGQGGEYDQAQIVHRAITRRRKSRFATQGLSPGKLCVISSTRYKGDFIDRRIKEVESNNETNVFVSRRKQYEVQPPEGRYCGETFRLLIGTDMYPTRVLEDSDQAGRNYPENATVEAVPVEYLPDFKNDPENALRDVLGISTDTLTPFITQRHKIIDAIVRWEEHGLLPWVENQNVTLADHGMPQIVEANLPKDRHIPRFVHVDLSSTSDRCGIGVSKILGHTMVEVSDGVFENLPIVCVEAAITIKPDAHHEIDVSDVRRWVTNLQAYYNFNIRTVSYDGFNSKESMQLLRKSGIRTRYISLDRTSEPYMSFRTALYQDRIVLIDNDILRQELASLEYHKDKDRIDHSPRLSKDASDAVAGSVFSALTSRMTRGGSGVYTPEGDSIASKKAERPAGTARKRQRPSRR